MQNGARQWVDDDATDAKDCALRSYFLRLALALRLKLLGGGSFYRRALQPVGQRPREQTMTIRRQASTTSCGW